MSVFENIERRLSRAGPAEFYGVFAALGMLLESGMNLGRALKAVSADQQDKRLAAALENAASALSAGVSAGGSFSKEKIFPRITAPTVAAGERSGRLAASFRQLSDIMWLEHNLYSRVQNALFVPKLAAVLMVILVTAYIRIAMPEYVRLYAETQLELPWLVKVVTEAVDTLVGGWPVTLAALFIFWRLLRAFTASHAYFIDSLRLKLPIYGALHKAFLQHQFAAVLQLMLVSGLTAQEALAEAAPSIANSVMASAVRRARESLLRGSTLSRALRENNADNVFDAMLIAALSAGERSGRLGEALGRLTKYYARLIDNLVEPVTTKITLLVMLPMGLIIVLVFAFTLLPTFGYIDQVIAR